MLRRKRKWKEAGKREKESKSNSKTLQFKQACSLSFPTVSSGAITAYLPVCLKNSDVVSVYTQVRVGQTSNSTKEEGKEILAFLAPDEPKR